MKQRFNLYIALIDFLLFVLAIVVLTGLWPK